MHPPWVQCTLSPPRSQPQFPCTSQVRVAYAYSQELACSHDGCRQSRISGSLWLETGGLFAVLSGGAISGSRFAPFPSPCLLPPVGDGPVHRQLAIRWNCLVPLFREWPAVCLSQLIFSLSLAIPQFKLLSHVSSL